MTTTQATTTFTIDPAHSSAEFSVRHMMLSKVRGAFRGLAGTIDISGAGPVPSSVKAEIEVASIDTREPQRDGHLKSADFFDAATFPHIRYASTSVADGGDGRFIVEGTLEIRGVSLPVKLDAEVAGRTVDPWGNDRIAFEAKTRINRKDFGLTYNQALETGGVLVGEDIDIELQIQAVAK